MHTLMVAARRCVRLPRRGVGRGCRYRFPSSRPNTMAPDSQKWQNNICRQRMLRRLTGLQLFIAGVLVGLFVSKLCTVIYRAPDEQEIHTEDLQALLGDSSCEVDLNKTFTAWILKRTDNPCRPIIFLCPSSMTLLS